MIQLSSIPVENKTRSIKNAQNMDEWKTLLSQSKMSTQSLLEAVRLDEHPQACSKAEKLFELRVPKPYLDKIEKGNINDPLLLQVLPQKSEHKTVSGFISDPLNEDQYSPVKGLIHKYKSRVLLISSSTCAINCRYCFRRTFPYSDHKQSKNDWQGALNYIRNNLQINEVILSGGDPLTHNNDYLFWLLTEIDKIDHIKRLRIHSRLLTALPQRIDSNFLNRLEKIKSKLVFVTHCNHPNEIDAVVESKLEALKNKGVILLNQSVLLKSVNDNAETLSRLSEALFEAGVQPYYLFIFDPVNGAAHFNISIQSAREIYQALLTLLPGYLVPKLSVEIPGQTSKTPIGLTNMEVVNDHIHL